jgi:hypothetical protein
MPFPFLFYRYGESIRLRCKYAAEAAKVLEVMRNQAARNESAEADDEEEEEIERQRSSAVPGHTLDKEKEHGATNGPGSGNGHPLTSDDEKTVAEERPDEGKPSTKEEEN